MKTQPIQHSRPLQGYLNQLVFSSTISTQNRLFREARWFDHWWSLISIFSLFLGPKSRYQIIISFKRKFYLEDIYFSLLLYIGGGILMALLGAEDLHGLTFNNSRSFASNTADCFDGLTIVSSAHLPMKSIFSSKGSNSVFPYGQKLYQRSISFSRLIQIASRWI